MAFLKILLHAYLTLISMSSIKLEKNTFMRACSYLQKKHNSDFTVKLKGNYAAMDGFDDDNFKTSDLPEIDDTLSKQVHLNSDKMDQDDRNKTKKSSKYNKMDTHLIEKQEIEEERMKYTQDKNNRRLDREKR
jgi:hypothetical protein